MSWVLLSAIPPLLWSINNLLDEYLAKSVFAKAGVLYIFLAASFDLIGCVLLYFFIDDIWLANIADISFMMLLGFGMTLSFVPYIFALQEDNALNTMPIFQTIPVFTLILAYIFLGETVTMNQLLAGLMIIVAAAFIGFDFQSKSINKKAVYLMFLTSFMGALVVVFTRDLTIQYDWKLYTFWAWVGSGIACVLLIGLKKNWRQFTVQVFQQGDRKTLSIFFAQVFAEMSAMAVFYKAVSIAPSVALVQTVNGLQPAFVLLFALTLGALPIALFPQIKIDRFLAYKLGMIGIIIYGVYLISL